MDLTKAIEEMSRQGEIGLYYTLGMNVSCNHVHSVPRGEIVTALARNIHKGNTTISERNSF